MAAVPDSWLIEIIGERVRLARKALRMSGAEVAAAAGVSQTNISKIERRGLCRVEPDTFAGLVTWLHEWGNVSREDAADYLTGQRRHLKLSPIMNRR